MLRFETLEQDLKNLGPKIGLPADIYKDMQGIRTKEGYRDRSRSHRSHYDEDPRCRTLVEYLCEDELKAFDYSFDQLPKEA